MVLSSVSFTHRSSPFLADVAAATKIKVKTSRHYWSPDIFRKPSYADDKEDATRQSRGLVMGNLEEVRRGKGFKGKGSRREGERGKNPYFSKQSAGRYHASFWQLIPKENLHLTTCSRNYRFVDRQQTPEGEHIKNSKLFYNIQP